jgi:hypothetical protein
MTKQDEEIAALRKELDELKAKVSPPKSTFVPMSDAEWIDRMHQAAERRANSWMPPSTIQEMAQHQCNQVMGGVINDRHAPNNPSMIPPSATSGASPRSAGSGTGYVDPRPLRPPDGVAQADRLMDAADARDRIELAKRIGAHEAAMRAAQKGGG